MSRLDSSTFIYIFTSLKACNDYILYRIDVLKHLVEFNGKPCTNTKFSELHPLLVFTDSVLPPKCSCVKLQTNLYFFSSMKWQPSFFGAKDSKSETDLYMIRESDLMDLIPSEHNTDVSKYLVKRANMSSIKHNPTSFTAKNKLYILSACPLATEFEVYSPDLDIWHVLPPRPQPGLVLSYVVAHKFVFFNISDCVLLSFNLEAEQWGTMTPMTPDVSELCSFQFLKPLVASGGTAFGFLYENHPEYDKEYDRLSICATPLPHSEHDICPEFMRPSISLNDEFWHALNSSRCPNATLKSSETFSDYIVALDGGKLLCLVSWGAGVQDNGSSLDPYTSYATLNFFEVAPRKSRSRNVDCANEHADGKYVARRCFKAKFLHIRGRARYVAVPRRHFKAKLNANVKADGKYVSRRCSKARPLQSRGSAHNVDDTNAKGDNGKLVFRRRSKAKLLHSRDHADNVDYGEMKADGKYMSNRCLEAKLVHSAQFIIKTTCRFSIANRCFCP